MKHLMTLLLSMCVMLAACGNQDNTSEKKSTEDKSAGVEVKVNKSDDAKKKIEQAKKRGKKKTNEEPTTEVAFNTERYNLARQCLLDATMVNTADCTGIQDSQEYSRAWNNLANEGYLCQNGHCLSPSEIETTTEAPSSQEVQTTEPATTQDVQTEQPVQSQETVPSSEIPVIQEPQTEQPLPDVQP